MDKFLEKISENFAIYSTAIYLLLTFQIIFLILIWITYRGLKSLYTFENLTLIKLKFLFIHGVVWSFFSSIFTLLEINPVSFFYAFTMYTLNSKDKNGFGLVDLTFILTGIFFYLITVYSGLASVFYLIVLVYIVMYGIIYYIDPRWNPKNKLISSYIGVNLVFSNIVSQINYFLFNLPYVEILSFLFLYLGLFSTAFVVLLKHSSDVEKDTQKISAILSQSSSELSNALGILKFFTEKVDKILVLLSDSRSKISSSTYQEIVSQIDATLSSFESKLSIFSKYLEKHVSDLQDKQKRLSNLAESTFKSLEVIKSTSESSNAINSELVSLSKLAIDSEKSVMGVSKAVKSIRELSRNLRDKMTDFEHVSGQFSVLAINIGVESSKVGKQATSFSNLAKQAKSFSESISYNSEEVINLVNDIDQKAEYTEIVLKTLVMSFVEIESGLKKVYTAFSSFYSSLQNITKDFSVFNDNVNDMPLIFTSLIKDLNYLTDLVVDLQGEYKKVYKFFTDLSSEKNTLTEYLSLIDYNLGELKIDVEGFKHD